MSHVETTAAFHRVYTLEGGKRRRCVERLAVRLPVVEADDLGKVLRDETGTVLLEHDGYVVGYIGRRREHASLGAWQEQMLHRARMGGGGAPLSGYGRPPVNGIADDGAAALDLAVAEAERTHIMVEGCVARLEMPVGLHVSVTLPGIGESEAFGTRVFRERTYLPWLAFPLTERAEAAAVSDALREALAPTMPRVAVGEVAPEGAPGVPVVSDRAAAERMAARMEAGREARWADALLDMVRGVAGHLGADALQAYASLRDARADGDGDRLSEALGAMAEALSAEARPEAMDGDAWIGLKVAALSLSLRLAGAPSPSPTP